MHPPEGYDLSKLHGRMTPLTEYGLGKAGYAFPVVLVR
jgi:hypothetical protein